MVIGLAASATVGAHAATLFNNGTFLDSGNLSILDTTTGATTLGVSSIAASNFTTADDFTVGGTGWSVSSLNFFGYQTSAAGYSFTNVTWSVVSGANINTGTVVASGTTASTNGGLIGYRVTDTTLTSTARAIYSIAVDVPDFSLSAGTYWLTWALAGTGASGPFVPPVSGSLSAGNSQQSPSGPGGYITVTDGGSLETMDLPFTITGTANPVPEPATSAMMVLGALGLWGAVKRRRSA